MSTQISNAIKYDTNGVLVPAVLVTIDDAVNPIFSTAEVDSLTASTAVACNASKVLISSSCTTAELAFVHGVTSAIQTQLNTVSSLATAALPSASFSDTGVTGKLLTGYVSGAGTVATTDTILQGIDKLNGN